MSTSARSGSPRPRRTSASASREIDDREEELERREARYETDYEIRLEKLEMREKALAELEEKLGSKETQLAAYVAQAQGALQRRESEWWDKQLGQRRRRRSTPKSRSVLPGRVRCLAPDMVVSRLPESRLGSRDYVAGLREIPFRLDDSR